MFEANRGFECYALLSLLAVVATTVGVRSLDLESQAFQSVTEIYGREVAVGGWRTELPSELFVGSVISRCPLLSAEECTLRTRTDQWRSCGRNGTQLSFGPISCLARSKPDGSCGLVDCHGPFPFTSLLMSDAPQLVGRETVFIVTATNPCLGFRIAFEPLELSATRTIYSVFVLTPDLDWWPYVGDSSNPIVEICAADPQFAIGDWLIVVLQTEELRITISASELPNTTGVLVSSDSECSTPNHQCLRDNEFNFVQTVPDEAVTFFEIPLQKNASLDCPRVVSVTVQVPEYIQPIGSLSLFGSIRGPYPTVQSAEFSSHTEGHSNSLDMWFDSDSAPDWCHRTSIWVALQDPPISGARIILQVSHVPYRIVPFFENLGLPGSLYDPYPSVRCSQRTSAFVRGSGSGLVALRTTGSADFLSIDAVKYLLAFSHSDVIAKIETVDVSVFVHPPLRDDTLSKVQIVVYLLNSTFNSDLEDCSIEFGSGFFLQTDARGIYKSIGVTLSEPSPPSSGCVQTALESWVRTLDDLTSSFSPTTGPNSSSETSSIHLLLQGLFLSVPWQQCVRSAEGLFLASAEDQVRVEEHCDSPPPSPPVCCLETPAANVTRTTLREIDPAALKMTCGSAESCVSSFARSFAAAVHDSSRGCDDLASDFIAYSMLQENTLVQCQSEIFGHNIFVGVSCETDEECKPGVCSSGRICQTPSDLKDLELLSCLDRALDSRFISSMSEFLAPGRDSARLSLSELAWSLDRPGCVSASGTGYSDETLLTVLWAGGLQSTPPYPKTELPVRDNECIQFEIAGTTIFGSPLTAIVPASCMWSLEGYSETIIGLEPDECQKSGYFCNWRDTQERSGAPRTAEDCLSPEPTTCAICIGEGPECLAMNGHETCPDGKVGCILANGSVALADSREDCELQYSCTGPCTGLECQDRARYPAGICVDTSRSLANCSSYGYQVARGVCVSSLMVNASSCESAGLTWETACASRPLNECQQRAASAAFLQCAVVQVLRSCETQDECERQRHCTDRDLVNSKTWLSSLEPRDSVCLVDKLSASGSWSLCGPNSPGVFSFTFGSSCAILAADVLDDEKLCANMSGRYVALAQTEAACLQESVCEEKPGAISVFAGTSWNLTPRPSQSCLSCHGTYKTAFQWTSSGRWIPGRSRALTNLTRSWGPRATAGHRIDFLRLYQAFQYAMQVERAESQLSHFLCSKRSVVDSVRHLASLCGGTKRSFASAEPEPVLVERLCGGSSRNISILQLSLFFPSTSIATAECSVLRIYPHSREAFATPPPKTNFRFFTPRTERLHAYEVRGAGNEDLIYVAGDGISFRISGNITRGVYVSVCFALDGANRRNFKKIGLGMRYGTRSHLKVVAVAKLEHELHFCSNVSGELLLVEGKEFYPVFFRKSKKVPSTANLVILSINAALYLSAALIMMALHLWITAAQRSCAVSASAVLRIFAFLAFIVRTVYYLLTTVSALSPESVSNTLIAALPTMLYFSALSGVASLWTVAAFVGNTTHLRRRFNVVLYTLNFAVYLGWAIFLIPAALLSSSYKVHHSCFRRESWNDLSTPTGLSAAYFTFVGMIAITLIAAVFVVGYRVNRFISIWSQKRTLMMTVISLGGFFAHCVLVIATLAVDAPTGTSFLLTGVEIGSFIFAACCALGPFRVPKSLTKFSMTSDGSKPWTTQTSSTSPASPNSEF